MATILSVPLSNQLQGVFIRMRDIYEIRERQSRVYSWTALVTSQLLIELPWNIFGSALLFCSWYWTVGFETSRAGYTYLMLGVVFPFYYTSIAQVSFSPTKKLSHRSSFVKLGDCLNGANPRNRCIAILGVVLLRDCIVSYHVLLSIFFI